MQRLKALVAFVMVRPRSDREIGMGKLRISIDLPEDALAISQLSRRTVGEEMRRLFFLDLVRDGRLSHAKAAELLEISLAEFLTFMARHRVSPFVIPEGELAQELRRSK